MYEYYDGTVEPKNARLRDVYYVLKESGIDVYFQSQHKGACKEPYVVVSFAGESKMAGFSTTISNIEVLCYVPLKYPSSIELFCEDVKKAMKKLIPMIKPQYEDLGDYVDDDINAVMRTMRYYYYRKID